MAARFALPSQAFSDVQRFLRQKRATGQTVSPRETRYAWQGYFDALSARRAESQRLGMQARGLDLREEEMRSRIGFEEERMEREEGAARVAGVSQLVSTGAMGAYALRGTKAGAAIGLGPAGAETPTGAAPALTTAAAAPAATAAEVGGTSAAIGMGSEAAAAAAAGEGAFTTAASAPLAAVGGVPGVGAAIGVGFLGSELGEYIAGNDAGEIIGGAAGGAGIGFAIGNVPGAIVGGVIGGAIGVVKAIKD